MAEHLVLINSTNTNIQYSGSWGEENITGTVGTAIDTRNLLTGSAGSLAFDFSGSSIAVYGSFSPVAAPAGSNTQTQAPIWACLIDNQALTPNPNFTAFPRFYGFFLCQTSSSLQDGPHTFNLSVNKGAFSFEFELVQYLPSSNVSLDQSILRIDSSDLTLQYSSGWNEFSENGAITTNYMITQTTGSTLTYQFSGVSLTWYGVVPPGFGSQTINSSATFAVDGSTPSTFVVPAANPLPVGIYEQNLFTTEQLSAGQHKLVVTYQGNTSTAPLALDFFLVQASSSTSNAPTSTMNPSLPLTSSTKSSRGAIIGGSLGGVIFLLLLSTLFLFYRKRRIRREGRLNEKPTVDVADYIVEPFVAPPSTITPSSPSTQNISSQSRPNTPTTSSNKRSAAPLVTSVTPGHGILPAVKQASNLRLVGSSMTLNEPEAVTMPAVTQQRPPSLHEHATVLRHEDSGVRMPRAEDDIVEMPPLYTAD